MLASGGDLDGATAAAREAMRLAPDDPRPAEQLASILADAGDAAALGPLADTLVARFPDREDPRYYRATALFLTGAIDQAITAARAVVNTDPGSARAQNLLGAACATAGQTVCARAAFEAALEANPRDATTYVNLGFFNLQSANPAGAAENFAEALSIDPASARARDGLAQARAALGTKP